MSFLYDKLKEDVIANRPAAGDKGRLFFSTDEKKTYYDTGSAWVDVSDITTPSESINAQTGTSYTVVAGDRATLVTFSNASAVAVTLPQATGSFTTGWYSDVRNLGVGSVTITPTTSTINGASTLVLATGQSARIVSDGTSYQITNLINNANPMTTKGDLTIGGASGAASRFGVGSDGQVLIADSTQTLGVKWASGASGSLVFLESHTASSSASLNFTSWYSSSYDEYIIDLVSILPSTNGVSLWLQASTDGGSTYDTSSANYEYGSSSMRTNGAGGGLGNGAVSGYPLWNTDLSSSSLVGLCGSGKLFNPGSTTLHKAMMWQTYTQNTGADFFEIRWAGRYKVTTAVDAFRIIASSGNLASGSIRIYGVAH